MRYRRQAEFEPAAFHAEGGFILKSVLTSLALILLLGVASALVSLAHLA